MHITYQEGLPTWTTRTHLNSNEYRPPLHLASQICFMMRKTEVPTISCLGENKCKSPGVRFNILERSAYLDRVASSPNTLLSSIPRFVASCFITAVHRHCALGQEWK